MNNFTTMFRTPLKTLGFLAIASGVFMIVLTGGWFIVAGMFFIINGLLLYLADYLVTRFVKKRGKWLILQIGISIAYLSTILWILYDIGAFDSRTID